MNKSQARNVIRSAVSGRICTKGIQITSVKNGNGKGNYTAKVMFNKGGSRLFHNVLINVKGCSMTPDPNHIEQLIALISS